MNVHYSNLLLLVSLLYSSSTVSFDQIQSEENLCCQWPEGNSLYRPLEFGGLLVCAMHSHLKYVCSRRVKAEEYFLDHICGGGMCV